MKHRGILTLTTDFGYDGPYVAAMKGVILGLSPDVQLVDVTHSIAPQNILEGAFVLSGLIDAFPPGTVHLTVVDPGVGTDRRLVAARVSDQWFVLPDNGLLTAVLLRHPLQGLWAITSERIRRSVVAPTFHGRDLLSPAAAHLVNGGDPADLGLPLERMIRLANLEPRKDGAGLVAEVIFRDTFGNLITNVTAEHLRAIAPLPNWTLSIAGETIEKFPQAYGEEPPGTLVALIGSAGWLEVALVNGDAGRHLAAGPGATIWLRPRDAAPEHALDL